MEASLKDKLSLIRAERGLTLRKAAKLTGVSKETLNDLERGRRKPHLHTLHKIARGYGVAVETLAGGAGQIDDAGDQDDQDYRVASELEELSEEALEKLISYYRKKFAFLDEHWAREGWEEDNPLRRSVELLFGRLEGDAQLALLRKKTEQKEAASSPLSPGAPAGAPAHKINGNTEKDLAETKLEAG